MRRRQTQSHDQTIGFPEKRTSPLKNVHIIGDWEEETEIILLYKCFSSFGRSSRGTHAPTFIRKLKRSGNIEVSSSEILLEIFKKSSWPCLRNTVRVEVIWIFVTKCTYEELRILVVGSLFFCCFLVVLFRYNFHHHKIVQKHVKSVPCEYHIRGLWRTLNILYIKLSRKRFFTPAKSLSTKYIFVCCQYPRCILRG